MYNPKCNLGPMGHRSIVSESHCLKPKWRWCGILHALNKKDRCQKFAALLNNESIFVRQRFFVEMAAFLNNESIFVRQGILRKLLMRLTKLANSAVHVGLHCTCMSIRPCRFDHRFEKAAFD